MNAATTEIAIYELPALILDAEDILFSGLLDGDPAAKAEYEDIVVRARQFFDEWLWRAYPDNSALIPHDEVLSTNQIAQD